MQIVLLFHLYYVTLERTRVEAHVLQFRSKWNFSEWYFPKFCVKKKRKEMLFTKRDHSFRTKVQCAFYSTDIIQAPSVRAARRSPASSLGRICRVSSLYFLKFSLVNYNSAYLCVIVTAVLLTFPSPRLPCADVVPYFA